MCKLKQRKSHSWSFGLKLAHDKWTRLFVNAMQSISFYDAQVWYDALSKEVYHNCLVQVQRLGALRVVSVYHAVSESIIMVFAGVTSITDHIFFLLEAGI